MKQLAHYTVEGLMRQGPHEVWITLGRYSTAEQAEETFRRRPQRDGIVATRVLPCYRLTPQEHAADHRGGITVA